MCMLLESGHVILGGGTQAQSTTVSEDISYRSSHQQVFLAKRVLKICGEFTGEHPC